MGIPRKLVFPKGITKSKQPVTALSSLKVLETISTTKALNRTMNQGLRAGTRIEELKGMAGNFSKIKAGRAT